MATLNPQAQSNQPRSEGNGNSNSNSNSGNRGPQIAEEGSGFSVTDLLENLFFFRWYFLGCFALVASLSIVYALIASPVYTANALIQIEEKKGSSLGALKDLTSALGAGGGSPVLGELEIIRSRTVVGEAVEALKANIKVTVDNRLPLVGGWLSRILDKGSDGLAIPLWANSSLAWGGEDLQILRMVVPPKVYGEPLFLKIDADQAWTLSDEEGKIFINGQGLDQEFASADQQYFLALSQIRARPGTVFKIRYFSIQSQIDAVKASVVAAETKRQSNIINITYENTNPVKAAAMLTAITDAYVGKNITRRSEESKKSLEFLNKELPKLKANLEANEESLRSFRSDNQTLDVPGEIKELLTQTTNIEKARLELELKRKEFQSRYQPDHPLLKGLNFQLAQLQTQTGQVNK